MKTESLRIQYKVLIKIFHDFFGFRQATIIRECSSPRTPFLKQWHTRAHQNMAILQSSERVTGNKDPAPGLYSRTLESSPQLLLSNNSFGTYS